MNAVKEKNKEMYRLLDQQNLCHRCKKAEQFPNRKFCPECLEKKTILRARYYDNFRKNEKSVAARREYQKRYREKHKSEGLCVRCNREATHGLYCYEHSIYVRRYEERRKERLKRQRRERGLIPEYRKEHNLCLFCGAPIDTTKHGRACSKCAAKFATHGNNEPLKKIINQYFTGGKQMNNTKEKSAVGAATPATEKDINISPENIISADEEKIKGQSENMAEILRSLSKTLRLTREGRKIKSIVPVTVPMQNEGYFGIYARITYMDGHTKDVDIGADSGIAAVYDVAKMLTFS